MNLLLKYKSAVAVAILAAAFLIALNAWGAAKKRAGVLQERLHVVDSSLVVAAAATAHVDTVRLVATKRFTQTVTVWKTDTVRATILAQPDSAVVPVQQYRRLSVALDSVSATAETALAASDSLAMAERREKLLWRTKAEVLQQLPPPRPVATHKWRHRIEGAALGAAVFAIARK